MPGVNLLSQPPTQPYLGRLQTLDLDLDLDLDREEGTQGPGTQVPSCVLLSFYDRNATASNLCQCSKLKLTAVSS